MAYQKGRSFVLKLGASGAGGVVAGIQTTDFKINNESVDVTNKDSNGFQTLLEGAGTKSVEISIAGVASDGATYETFKGYAQSDSINIMQLLGADSDAIEASFQISNLSESGEHNGAVKFSATLKSSGTVTYTNV